MQVHLKQHLKKKSTCKTIKIWIHFLQIYPCSIILKSYLSKPKTAGFRALATVRNHGTSRRGSRGKSDASRMFSRPQQSITTRSNPAPKPPRGGAPYLQINTATVYNQSMESNNTRDATVNLLLWIQAPRLFYIKNYRFFVVMLYL